MKKILAYFLFFIFLLSFFDLCNQSLFLIEAKKANSIIQENFQEERDATYNLNDNVTFICLSSCYIDIGSKTIEYALQGKRKLLLTGKYPYQEYTYQK